LFNEVLFEFLCGFSLQHMMHYQ